MSNTSKTIVFFGTEQFSLTALTGLIEAGYSIAAVVTKPDSPQGRGHTLTPPPVKLLAEQHHIPVWQPQRLSDIANDLKQLDHPLGVLVSYGKILPQAIIDLFTPGIINVHPSLLPLYRGPSPIESAILHGDQQTGVSIMQLSRAMDAGPVYAQSTIQLDQTETSYKLYETLGSLGTQLLIDTLPHIINGSLQPTPQDANAATYCPLIQKSDGIINWQLPARSIEQHIRAYQGWPGSRTTLGGIDTIITKASVVDETHGTPGTLTLPAEQPHTLLIATTNGSLSIETLKPIGKKEMPVAAFLSGYSSQLR